VWLFGIIVASLWFLFTVSNHFSTNKTWAERYRQEFERSARLYDENRRLKTRVKSLESQNNSLNRSLVIEETLKDKYKNDTEFYKTVIAELTEENKQ
jgi:uncharacterized protein YlxW (UPF0749 family)